MDCRYIKHYSRSLDREMEYKTYGDTGVPVLVFPSQDGRFFDYENFGMIDTVARHIEDGKIRLICVDGIDLETWSNSSGDPRKRIERHEQWYHYITDELIPEVRRGQETFIATGCSMGGFHAATIFFRRPDFFNTLLSLSGVYSARYFMGNYFDGTVYDNSVTDFLSLTTTLIGTNIAKGVLYAAWDKGNGKTTFWNRHAVSTPFWLRKTSLTGLTIGDLTAIMTGHGGVNNSTIS